jgi:hypothetical protein
VRLIIDWKIHLQSKEIYENEIVGKYNLLCVYDDRIQVLDMWYDQSIFTLCEPRFAQI